MGTNKTIETKESVSCFLKTITDAKKQTDVSVIIELVTKHTGLEPKMWGTSIVGFGSYHYKYESGREGDAPLAGLASRTNAITLYLGSTFNKREELLSKFGKYKVSGGCIHFKKLEDIDTDVLIKMFKNSIEYRKKERTFVLTPKTKTCDKKIRLQYIVSKSVCFASNDNPNSIQQLISLIICFQTFGNL